MRQRTDWQPDDSRVLVVAGRDARDQALKHGQNRRGFRPSGRIAFYADNKIDTWAEIAGPPEDDVQVGNLAELPPDAQWSPGRSDQPRTVIRLKNVSSIGPIENNKMDRLGPSYRLDPTAAVHDSREIACSEVHQRSLDPWLQVLASDPFQLANSGSD